MNTGNVVASLLKHLEKYVCGGRAFMQIDILKRKKKWKHIRKHYSKVNTFHMHSDANLKNKPVLPLTFKWKKSKYKWRKIH